MAAENVGDPVGAVLAALPDDKLGDVYEFRIYTYQPGTMPSVLEWFGQSNPGGR